MNNNEENKGTGNNTFFDRLEKDFAERNEPIGEETSGSGETLNRSGVNNRPNQTNRFRQNSGYDYENNSSSPNNLARNRMPSMGRNNQNEDSDENSPADELKDRIKDEASRKLREEATKKIKQKATEETGKEVAKQAGKEVAKQAGKEVIKKGVETAIVEGGGTTAAAAGGTVAATAGGATVATGAGSGIIAFLSTPAGWITIGVILVLIVVVFILIIVMAIAIYKNSLTDIEMQDGYALVNTDMCEYVTVNTGSNQGTYPFEQYVAGVVAGEVGFFGNDTVFKAAAIAARGYFYTHNKDCSIAGDTSKQVYAPPTAATTAAAKATEGIMVIKNGSVLGTEYDAFAYKSEDSSNYYIHQQNQAIPKSWADSKGLTKSLGVYKNAWHGRGMSQWGALYLAETGKTYEQILKYYYGSDITLAKAASALTFNPDFKPTVTSQNNILHQPLDQFLVSRGSSVAQVNQSIFNAVNKAGYGTGKGVAAAAYSLVTVLDQNFGIRIPYAHGGHAVYMNSPAKQAYTSPLGVDGAWGTKMELKWGTEGKWGQVDANSPYYGIDCNGFAQWAIYNGGFNYIHVYTDAASMSKYGSTCKMTDSNCNGEPGDLLVNGGHVVVIVGATANNYIIAESGSQATGIYISNKPKHSDRAYSVVKMKNFYSNSSNRR